MFQDQTNKGFEEETGDDKPSLELFNLIVAKLSHDIRTPMNSIIGFADLLGEDDIGEPERKQYTEIIQTGTRNLLSMINDIIDIAKIESSQVVLLPENTDLRKFMEVVTDEMESELKRTGRTNVRLVRNINCPQTGKWFSVDQNRLRQILWNLFTNALKATRQGTVEIGCDSTGPLVKFYVRDTGKGIDPASLKTIFDRFSLLEEKLNHTRQGTGLGLGICNGLVTLMGGTISATSEAGKGSEFRFELPVNL